MTFRRAWIFLLACPLAGCLSSDAVNRNYNLSKIHRIGVLKFNYGSFPQLGAEDIFAQFLLERGYDVIERSRLEAVMAEQKLGAEGLFAPGSGKDIGKLLGVDALLMGQLTQYEPDRRTVVMVQSHETFEEPVLQVRERKQPDGSVVKFQEQIGTKVRRENKTLPQSFPIDATVGITAKLVDVETGEIAWIGSYATEGVNAQTALESAAAYLAQKLAKQWKTASR